MKLNEMQKSQQIHAWCILSGQTANSYSHLNWISFLNGYVQPDRVSLGNMFKLVNYLNEIGVEFNLDSI